MNNIQNKPKFEISIPAVLYIKSYLLLNGVCDMSIKDLLLQSGFDLDKINGVYFNCNNKLIFVYDGEEIYATFDFCELLNTKKIALRITFEGEFSERLQCIFIKDPKTKKTKLIKDDELINRWIYFDDNELNSQIKGRKGNKKEQNMSFCLQERICSGLVSPCLIVLKANDANSYSNFIKFKLIKYGNDNFYDIDSRNYLELQKYLMELKFPISVETVYKKICEIYSLDPQNIGGDYKTYLELYDKNNNLYSYYSDKFGQIKVVDNGKTKEYKRLILKKSSTSK